MRLGTSQKAVLEWLSTHDAPATEQEVGDALYSTTSSCASWNKGSAGRRREWAQRVLRKLGAHGLVTRVSTNPSVWALVAMDDSLKLPLSKVQALADEIKMMLHAHRDCLRNRGVDTQKTQFDCREGFYGEAFGILRGMAVLGHGYLHGATNTPEETANLKWWFDQLQQQVLKQENYPGKGGDDSGRCDYCLERYGKDGAGRRRV